MHGGLSATPQCFHEPVDASAFRAGLAADWGASTFRYVDVLGLSFPVLLSTMITVLGIILQLLASSPRSSMQTRLDTGCGPSTRTGCLTEFARPGTALLEMAFGGALPPDPLARRST